MLAHNFHSDLRRLRKIGVFLGIQSSFYEYIAHIITPYQLDYVPKIGGFVLIQNLEEFIVARIMDLTPKGELTTFTGEKWLADVSLYDNAIGQDIKNQKISYQVRIKLLGRLSNISIESRKEFSQNKHLNQIFNYKFIPGLETIPHITSSVFEPNQYFQELICSQATIEQSDGIQLGTYSLNPSIKIYFDVKQLVSKRTFIFARAGYGKSNLMKCLASNWKPTHGALFIFDPEGEYSVTDKKGRPGILDKLPAIVITNRHEIKQEIKNNIYTTLKFNLKEFSPSFIIPILVSEQKHETIFFQKLMSLKQTQWEELVDLIYEEGWGADDLVLTHIVVDSKANKPDESVGPFKNNLVSPIKKIHHPESKLLNILERGAKKRMVIVIDISLLDSHTSLQLSSIIVAHFFNLNQKAFVGGKKELSKIVFVMEEAQSVLGESSNVEKFVELAKEGRKYQLGGIFITQQPASISSQILSQADNFFVFHMISKKDLSSLQNTNAHYSNDILTQILSEPIPGKCYFWSSPQPFVLPMNVMLFDNLVKPHNAASLQKLNDLLTPILAKVTQFDKIEEQILLKLKEVILNAKIDINSQKIIDEHKRELSIQTYTKLNSEEKSYLRQKGWTAINSNSQEEYGINFSFLRKLIEKSKLR